jgi:hypothetical protein
MKRIGLVALLPLMFILRGASQELKHEVRVVNIAVPVRVFDGDKFVDSLKLEDFEVLEDGVPQKIEALYLFKKTSLERKEEQAAFRPEAARHFYLFFSMFDYDPKIPKMLDRFFADVIRPGDDLMVITPRAAYDMKKALLEKTPAKKIGEQLTTLLKKDIQAGDSAYRTVLADLKRLVGAGGIQSLNPEEAFRDEYTAYGSGSPEEFLMKYQSDLKALESLRTIDEAKILKFGESIKKLRGQKIVFFFYQQEFVPIPPVLKNKVDDPNSPIAGLFDLIDRKSQINAERIKKAYSDSSINLNFLYISKRPMDVPFNQVMEASDDIFPPFRSIAESTGGVTASSANPDYLMRQASLAAENYYLLYYSPKNKNLDGSFRNITVRAKAGNYRLAHLAGYFAKDVPVEEPLPLIPPTPEPKPETKLEAKPAAPMNETRAAEVAVLLGKSAAYCRRLENAALNFVCYEYVSEQIFLPKSVVNESSSDVTLFNPITPDGVRRFRARDWAYDYQLIRTGGQTQEKRTLLMEDGEKRKEENVELRPTRFSHRNLVLGPLGLFGGPAQASYVYTFVKEGKVDGEPAIVVEVIPKKDTDATLSGKAWLREKDGAVLRIEWAPLSIADYGKVVQFSAQIGYRAKLTFQSEYGFEKKGLRFPNSHEVIESYVGLSTTWGNVFSKTNVTYKDYKFFQVETAVDIR